MSKKLKMLESALKMYGLNEMEKGHYNKQIMEVVNQVSEEIISNNIPWCAAFVGFILKNNDYQYSVGLNARSYLQVGKKVDKPELGDIAIFWRGSIDGWKGHVGFYIAETESLVFVLGGNQDNQVCIKPYPKKQLLEYRTPVKQSPMAVGSTLE